MSPGTVTILASDFRDSTPLFESLGDEGAYEVLRPLMGLLREAVKSAGGQEFNSTGDGLLVAFTSSLSAIQCAVSMQQAIANHKEGETAQLGLSIGLTVGEPIEDEGNYFGAPVNLAARLCSMANSSHILVSGVLRSVLGSRGGYRWRQLGQVQARGIGPVEAWALLWPGIDEQSEALRPPSDAPNLSRQQRRSASVATLTILFIDVVDSTPITARMGDTAFRARSRDLDGVLRGVITAAGGIAVEGKVLLLGDGVMAIFTSASSAIEAALRCRDPAAASELELHIGLHAGDVIDEGDNVYGWAVNVASRICAASAPGEVLVSETVRSLARASTDARFEDRGLHELKGIEEPQRLFAVRAL